MQQSPQKTWNASSDSAERALPLELWEPTWDPTSNVAQRVQKMLHYAVDEIFKHRAVEEAAIAVAVLRRAARWFGSDLRAVGKAHEALYDKLGNIADFCSPAAADERAKERASVRALFLSKGLMEK